MPEDARRANTAFAAAGWFEDPTGAHELRYWDGEAWTDHVSDGGAMSRTRGVEGAPLAPPPAPARSAPGTTARPSRLVRNSLLIAFASLLVAVPAVLVVVAIASGGADEAVIEPFDNPDAACEAWWRTNVIAARDGWQDARLRSELRRIATASENVDAQFADLLRTVASARDTTTVGDNSQAAYQRCVGVHRWRGATDDELSIMASPAPPR